MSYIGDFRLGDTFDTKFTTVSTIGAPTTLAGSPTIAAYVGNSTTEITAGITLTVDFDSRTGMHNIRVVATSGNGYATASNYQLVVTAGTVGGTSIVGYVVGEFSIEARSAVMPTTVGRTLDVSAGGEAGVDWANVGSQSTSVNLSATTTNVVNTATAVTTVNGLAANTITAAATAADFGTEVAAAVWDMDATGHQTQGTFGQAIGDPVADTNTIYKAVVTDAAGATVGVDIVAIQADTDNVQTRLPAALVGGRMDSSVGAMAADTLTASALATDAVTEIQTGLATSASIAALNDFNPATEEVLANVKKVNSVTIVGNGSTTPFNV